MNNIQNPWTNISWNNPFADEDKNYSVKLGKQEFPFGSEDYIKAVNAKDEDNTKKNKKKVGLRFDCLPDPFYGDPESRVYLLGMNPGGPDYDFNKDNDRKGEYEENCKAMLKHDIRYLNKPGLLYDSEDHTIIYDPNKYNEIINDIFDNERIKEFRDNKDKFPLRPHVGDVWQWEMWKQLRKELKGRNPNVFSIEYFPYHSNSGFAFPEWLPSYKYRNWLIQKAMEEHKLIIIMRNEKSWYDIKFDGEWNSLKDYPNKIFLRNKQRIWLTPGNFVWEVPEERISMPNWVCQSIKEIIEKFDNKR
jgi:hypothetical protein